MRLIDADKLMQCIKKKLCISSFDYLMDSEKAIINVIESEPSIEMPTWIPCSERLPEDVQIGDEYPIVIFCTKENTYTGFYEYYLGGRWWADDGDYVVDDVIAWMPLPKPWEGADDE